MSGWVGSVLHEMPSAGLYAAGDHSPFSNPELFPYHPLYTSRSTTPVVGGSRPVANGVSHRPITLTLLDFGTFSNANFVGNRMAVMQAKRLYFSGFRGKL